MSKITDSGKANSLVQSLIEYDATRSIKRTKVDGMIAGNAPFDPKILKQTGQSHRCNVNFREGEGIINKRNNSFFQLFLDGRTLVEARLRDKATYQGIARFWENIVMEELKDLLEDWDDFSFEMMVVADSMNRHGASFPLWTKRNSWKWKAFKTGEVLFPKNTKASAGYINCACILDVISVADLVKYGKNAQAKEIGWNQARIREVIEEALNKKGISTEEWEELQRDIENNSIAYEASVAGEIKVAHLLVMEDEGKISHYIVQRGKTKDDFIFKQPNAFERIREVFVPFICGIGNGYFHGLKGIGHRIYPSVVINNRFLCRAVDGAMDSASLVVSFKDGTSRKGKTLRIGNQIVLPPGAALEQHHMEKNLQGVTGIYSLLTQVNQSSVGVKRPGLGVVAQGEKAKHSARGETMQAAEEVELESTDLKLFYQSADRLYSEMCRRIFTSDEADARKFRERCIEKGIPEKLMSEPDRWKFRAPRAVGSGSKVMRRLDTQENLSVAPYLPEVGKRHLIEDFLEARGGPEAVQRYFPPYEDDRMPSRSHQMAQIENTLLAMGTGQIVSTDDWHVTHLESHFPFAEQYLDGVFEDNSPEKIAEAMAAVTMFIDHMGNHMSYLQGDDLHAKQFGEMQGRMKAFAEKAKMLEQAYNKIVEQQKQQQQEQQKQMQEVIDKGDQTELQKHMMEIKADQDFKVLKEMNNHQVRLAKMQNSISLATSKAQADIELMKAKAMATRGE